MKASKPVSFLQLVYDSVIRKFWTLALVFVWKHTAVTEAVGVASLSEQAVLFYATVIKRTTLPVSVYYGIFAVILLAPNL